MLGIDLGPVIAGAGLAGVALAFGAQSVIRDLLAGLFILPGDHFAIGDEVDLGEAVGTVEKMTFRVTVLRDLDGTVWHVRNGAIGRVGNLPQVWSGAMVEVVVAHGSDLAAARGLLHEVALALAADPPFDDDVLEPPEVLGVERMDADGITLRLRVKTRAGRSSGCNARCSSASPPSSPPPAFGSPPRSSPSGRCRPPSCTARATGGRCGLGEPGASGLTTGGCTSGCN